MAMVRNILIWLVLGGTAVGCGGGEDFMPVYFPTAGASGDGATPSTGTPPSDGGEAAAKCTVEFTSTLCVSLKGPNVSVGNTGAGEEAVCTATLPPIPIEIDGLKVTLRGDLFPDIVVEGHGLPVPITINGRGNTDGRDNLGRGERTSAGDLTISDFTFYVNALDQVGKIPQVALTTGTTPSFPNVEPITGSPADASGAMTLVGATALGALFPSADAYLKGAILTVRFEGKIAPTLAACGSGAAQPTHLEITKLVADPEGKEVAIPIPDGNRLEVSTGTFISTAPTDIGPRFEAEAKFRLRNISDGKLTLQIPPRVGPFHLSSPSSLNRALPTKGEMILRVRFRPEKAEVKDPGPMSKSLRIGGDDFLLAGTAVEPRGDLSVNLLSPTGVVVRQRTEDIAVGTLSVAASPQRAYFSCATLLCGGAPLPTRCAPCVDATNGHCTLLAISRDGEPVDEVTDRCERRFPRAREHFTVDLGQGGRDGITPASQLVALQNAGPLPLTITAIRLTPTAHTAAGEFVLRPQEIRLGSDFSKLGAAPAGGTAPTLPLTLPAYDAPLRTTQAFVAIGYMPQDLRGSDGRVAGIGAAVTDRAILEITFADGRTRQIAIEATTIIKDVPPLEAYFAGGAGLKPQADGSDFALRGLTHTTTETAVPLFLRVADGASQAVRITGVSLGGPEASAFRFLDSREEIQARPAEGRCTIPVYGPDGGIIGTRTDTTPVSLAPSGYALLPGAHSLQDMPFFGCVSFARDPALSPRRQYTATLTVHAQPLGTDHKPLRNPDGSLKQSTYEIRLLAVIEPMQGRRVLRITQTMSLLLNPQFPTIASSLPYPELQASIAEGEADASDQFLVIGAMILDPFDEMEIANEAGEIVTMPGDGLTGVFRVIDTHPTPTAYEDPFLLDYTSLLYDTTLPAGERGIFFDYDGVPEGFRANSLKVFTQSLSYPGPLAPDADKPRQPSRCEQVDPCDPVAQRKLGTGPTAPGKKGVCSFYHISAGTYDSPAFHTADEMPEGKKEDLCALQHRRAPLKDFPGYYTLDGHVAFDIGLRFWGPSYFHNAAGPLGSVPPLDELFHFNLTTRVLVPPSETPGLNLVPEPRLNLSRQEYKLNLTDAKLEAEFGLPQVCPRNSQNEPFHGKRYSSWTYLKPLLSKDPEGLVPTGCPEEGFSGGSAYLHGRPLDHETGQFTVVGVSKFSNSKNHTFAFQDVIMFVVLNGWMCDPTGLPEEYEGLRCYDHVLNPRDIDSQITILPEGRHE